MSETLLPEELLHREALKWFHRTNTAFKRQLPDEKIVEVYKKVKAYAQSDSLLTAYYEANHMHL